MASRASRPIRIEGDRAVIPLTRGHEAIIDADDLPMVDGNWYALVGTHAVYAQRERWKNGRRRSQLLHRLILGAPPNLKVDHINGDGLDNRRANLRLASHAQNLRNQKLSCASSSGFKGVTWDKRRGRWKAQISFNAQNINLGHFDTPELAHAAYCSASENMHGKFGRLA